MWLGSKHSLYLVVAVGVGIQTTGQDIHHTTLVGQCLELVCVCARARGCVCVCVYMCVCGRVCVFRAYVIGSLWPGFASHTPKVPFTSSIRLVSFHTRCCWSFVHACSCYLHRSAPTARRKGSRQRSNRRTNRTTPPTSRLTTCSHVNRVSGMPPSCLTPPSCLMPPSGRQTRARTHFSPTCFPCA